MKISNYGILVCNLIFNYIYTFLRLNVLYTLFLSEDPPSYQSLFSLTFLLSLDLAISVMSIAPKFHGLIPLSYTYAATSQSCSIILSHLFPSQPDFLNKESIIFSILSLISTSTLFLLLSVKNKLLKLISSKLLVTL